MCQIHPTDSAYFATDVPDRPKRSKEHLRKCTDQELVAFGAKVDAAGADAAVDAAVDAAGADAAGASAAAASSGDVPAVGAAAASACNTNVPPAVDSKAKKKKIKSATGFHYFFKTLFLTIK